MKSLTLSVGGGSNSLPVYIYIVQSVYNIPFLYNTRIQRKIKSKERRCEKIPKEKRAIQDTHTIRYGDGKGKRRRWQELCKSFDYKEKKDSRGAIFDKSGVGHVAPTASSVQPHQVSGGSPAFFSIEGGEKITSPFFEIVISF